jgi:peptidoglycan/LPS O-acetylase OafA/YrhL
MFTGLADSGAAGCGAGYVAALDGLRGLAALVVFLRHTSNAIAIPVGARRALVEGPLAPLLNSQGAVQLFFVLSGFVLASSLSRSTHRVHWLRFYVKRFFRIYPPYVFAVLLAWGASQLWSPIALGPSMD